VGGINERNFTGARASSETKLLWTIYDHFSFADYLMKDIGLWETRDSFLEIGKFDSKTSPLPFHRNGGRREVFEDKLDRYDVYENWIDRYDE
jgi:hypothetical protein